MCYRLHLCEMGSSAMFVQKNKKLNVKMSATASCILNLLQSESEELCNVIIVKYSYLYLVSVSICACTWSEKK